VRGAIACGDVTSRGAMVASTLRSAKLNRMRIFQSFQKSLNLSGAISVYLTVC
jgi:hypothetical protein